MRFLFLCVLTTAAACGGSVEVNQGSGTTGGGGASTSAQSTAVSTAVSSSSSSTGGPQSCGGKAGGDCGPDQYCQYGPMSVCGNFDVPGVCQPRPPGCDPDCPGVCGCDGKFYCNTCDANAAGFDVSTDMACNGKDSYVAISLFTNVPRFAILKASPQRNLCFRLTFSPSAAPGIDIMGDTFGVEKAEVTHDVKDCFLAPGALPPPVGESYPVTSGSGMSSFTKAGGGCSAGIHAKVIFSGGPPWVPPEEPLDAGSLVIQGGCP